jgi:hypothetical protein
MARPIAGAAARANERAEKTFEGEVVSAAPRHPPGGGRESAPIRAECSMMLNTHELALRFHIEFPILIDVCRGVFSRFDWILSEQTFSLMFGALVPDHKK